MGVSSFYGATKGAFGVRQMDISKEMALNALEENKGIVSYACKSIGLARSTFYNWINTDPAFKASVDDITETAIDYVESKLMEKIEGVKVKKGEDKQGDDVVYDVPPSDTAIIFYLKCKAKKRGYIEKTEVEHSGEMGVHWHETKTYETKDDGATKD